MLPALQRCAQPSGRRRLAHRARRCKGTSFQVGFRQEAFGYHSGLRSLSTTLAKRVTERRWGVRADRRFRVEARVQPHPPAPRSPPRAALSLAREHFAEKRTSGSRPRRVTRCSRYRPIPNVPEPPERSVRTYAFAIQHAPGGTYALRRDQKPRAAGSHRTVGGGGRFAARSEPHSYRRAAAGRRVARITRSPRPPIG